MIQTVKPLMLETVHGSFINADLVRTANKVDDEYEDGTPILEHHVQIQDDRGGIKDLKITKASYDLLTDSSAKSSKLDMQG